MQDQRTERKSTVDTRDTKLLARLERKKICKESEKRRQDQTQVKKETLTMVSLKKVMGHFMMMKQMRISANLLLNNVSAPNRFRCAVACHET